MTYTTAAYDPHGAAHVIVPAVENGQPVLRGKRHDPLGIENGKAVGQHDHGMGARACRGRKCPS